MIFKTLAILATLALSACGGGSATQSAPPIPPPVVSRPLSNVVAFMGDSITHRWDLTQYGIATLNFGVNGDTTAKMLARFDAVVATAPGVVVIEGGEDDLILDGSVTIDSVKAMAAKAKASGIRVIIGSALPVNMPADWQATFLAEFPNTKLDEAHVTAFNEQLIALAQENGYLFADYHDAMLTPSGLQDLTLFADAVHPNAAGYAKMWAVIAPLIAEDLN